MKIKIVAILVLIIGLSACTSNTTSNDPIDEKEQSFLLEGTIFNDAEYAYLYQLVNEKPVVTDSVKIENKSFKFKEQNIVPQLIYVAFDNSQKMTLFAENSHVIMDVKGYSKDSIKVTGSKINMEWDDIVLTVQLQNLVLDSLYNAYYDAEETGDEELVEKIGNDYGIADSVKLAIVADFIDQNPASHITPYLTIKYMLMQSDLDELMAYKSDFDSSISNSIYIPIIDKRIENLEKTKIGVVIPDFSQADKDGNLISISDLRGQYVLIDFWASWCGPCRGENPNVVEAYKTYKKDGFTVLGVSLDDNKENWLQAIEDDHLDWYHVSDLLGWENSVAQEFGVKGIPFSILIDKEGVILGKNLRGEELQETLAGLFE